MKRTKVLCACLLIFIVSVSCELSDIGDWWLREAELMYYDQTCDTLKVGLENAKGHSVRVSEEWFSCTYPSLEELYLGAICTGEVSSLDPIIVVKVYSSRSSRIPHKIFEIENKRDWNICDFDGDGAVDAEDACPPDPERIYCPCDSEDQDTDGDNIFDCLDACADDPGKGSPGICGCGFTDEDTDQDGVVDCHDECPDDSDKTEPGICGCGVGDTDGDGVPDCLDECPEDPAKQELGYCGCGKSETDTDQDGTPDCVDLCPEDNAKTEPGTCGCGVSDEDEDGDGMIWCEDPCPGDAWHDTVGEPCDHDEDGDGITDNADGCPFDPKKTSPGSCGCGKPETGCGVPH